MAGPTLLDLRLRLLMVGLLNLSFMLQLFIYWQLHTWHCVDTKAEIGISHSGALSLIEETGIEHVCEQIHFFI